MADQTPPAPDPSSFKDIRDILREINAELGKQIDNVKDASKAYSGLEGIAKKLQNDEEAISKLSTKQLKDLKTKAELNLRDLKAAAEKLDYSTATTAEEIALLYAKRENFQIEQELLDKIKKRLDQEIKIQKTIGLTGKLLKGMSQIPIVGQMIDTQAALEKARDAAEGGAGRLGAMGAALASIGKDIFSNLTDPLTLTVGLIGGFFKLLISSDKAVGDLAKGVNISYISASKLRQEFADIKLRAEDSYITIKGLQDSFLAINQTLGSSASINEKDLVTFTKLREQAGYTNDELTAIYKVTLATGGTLEDNVKKFSGTVQLLNAQNKLSINEKQLLKDIYKVSDYIKLSVGGTAEKIAEAAFKAKQFGINLQQADQISQKLLNFEESISDQISAELLTGKELNLERARLLALNGDIAGASAEILEQVGGTAEFSAMNRIQQEAIAKAVGLSRDDLAKSLVEREALARLGKQEGNLQEEYNRLKAQGLSQEQIAAKLGNESLAKQLAQNSLADDMNKLIEQLQELFIPIANAILPKIKDFLNNHKDTIMNMVTGIGHFAMALANILGDSEKLAKIFDGIKYIVVGLAALKLTSLIAQLTSAAVASGALAAGTAAAASAITFGVAAIAIIAGITSIMSAFDDAKASAENVKDGIISNSGLVVGKYDKGTIQPIAQGAPEDNVIFTTNKPQQQAIQSSAASINIDALIKEQQNTNNLLSKLLNKEGTVNIDSTKSGTATNIGTYKIQ